MKTIQQLAQEIFDDLIADGYDADQIEDFCGDGEALTRMGLHDENLVDALEAIARSNK